MRVVLDTNILISACWKPGGNESKVVALVAAGQLIVCVSETLEAEYREVAERKKFAKYRECLDAAIDLLLAGAHRVQPIQTCTACSDSDDNQLLDCALAGQAQYVITGNLRHFPAEWRGVRVVNARSLLQLAIGEEGGC